MIRNSSFALFAAAMLSASTPAFAAIDISTLSEFKVGTTTSQQVRAKYGAPDSDVHYPSGRYICTYKTTSPVNNRVGSVKKYAVFTFGKDGKLSLMGIAPDDYELEELEALLKAKAPN